MGLLEDKIIRDKIDSIADLPEDYQPSLQGKWELMENAMPERKNSRKIIFAIAASILLLIGFSALFFKNVIVQKPEIVLQHTIKGNIGQPEKVKQVVEKNIIRKVKNVDVSKNVNSRKTTQIFAANKSEMVKQEIKDSVIEKTFTKDLFQENKTASTLLVTKKSKKLYVEIDFNDTPQIQQKTENKMAENKVKFKVSIFKNKSKITEETQPSTVLKISKEFPINN